MFTIYFKQKAKKALFKFLEYITIKKKLRITLSYFPNLNNPILCVSASSLKTFGTSTEATCNTDYDMRDFTKEANWEEGLVITQLIGMLFQSQLKILIYK